MAFANLCPPALIYLVFSMTQVIIDTFQGAFNTAFIKVWVALIFTVLLNFLCKSGLGIVSWFIVFIPFILMTVIVTMLLVMFGLDPMTGKRRKDWKRKGKPRSRRPAYPWGPDRQPTDAEKRTEWIFSGDKSGRKETNDYYKQMSEQRLRDRADRWATRRGDMEADVRSAVDSEIGTQGGKTTHFPRGSRLIARDSREAVDFEVGRPILPHKHRILYAQNNI